MGEWRRENGTSNAGIKKTAPFLPPENIQQAIAQSQDKFESLLGARNAPINGSWTNFPSHMGTHTNNFFAELAKSLKPVVSKSETEQAMLSLRERIEGGVLKGRSKFESVAWIFYERRAVN